MITYENLKGRDLLEEKHDTKERLKRLEDKFTNQQGQITNLQHHVKILTRTSEGYRDIRDRFLEVCKRDVLGGVDRKGYQKINKGNVAAHEGDAIADTELYISGKRSDEDVLTYLYGLTVNQISRLSKYQISVLKSI